MIEKRIISEKKNINRLFLPVLQDIYLNVHCCQGTVLESCEVGPEKTKLNHTLISLLTYISSYTIEYTCSCKYFPIDSYCKQTLQNECFGKKMHKTIENMMPCQYLNPKLNLL